MSDCNVHHMTTGGVCRDCGTPWSAMTTGQHEDAVLVATPPTPDPRERGEDSEFTALPYWEKAKRLGLPGDMVPAINAACDELFRLRAPAPSERGEAMDEADLRAADIIARAPLTNGPAAIEHLAKAYLALRAPAPSEAVAEDDRALRFAAWLTTRPGVMTIGAGEHAGPMAEAVHEWRQAHPAPARGVTAAARDEFFGYVSAELDRAYAKHGREPWGRHEFFAILKEEVDELWDDIKADAPDDPMYKEMVQVAAMCFRFFETGGCRYRRAALTPDAEGGR